MTFIRICDYLQRNTVSDDPPHFKESFQIVDLAERHGQENQGFEERPPYHSLVSRTIN